MQNNYIFNTFIKMRNFFFVYTYRNTEKHLFRTNSEVLIFLDSVRRSPTFIVFLRRSEPAKSQNDILK